MFQVAALRRPLLGLIATSFGLSACATTPVLKPEPGDALAPGLKNVAEATAAGVRVLVAGDAWKGDPSDLGQLFTPVQVTIENNSGKDLRVSYPDFQLNGSSGFKYSAIPPMSARGLISQRESSPTRAEIQPALYQPGSTSGDLPSKVQLVGWVHRYAHHHFFIAPHVSAFYAGWGVWPYWYPYDPFYYDSLYAYWPKQLPTKDMLSQAMPEGVLQNGGKVAGFLYFQGVGERESSVTFGMTLVDSTSGQSLGRVMIPLVVSK